MNKANAALYGLCEDVLIKLALEELALEDAETTFAELRKTESDIPEQAMSELYEKGYRLLQERLKREERNKRRKNFIAHTLPRVAQVAAAIVSIFYLGVTVAYATIPVVRHQLFQLLVRFEETHARISMEPYATLDLEVPQEWEGTHFPSHIPSGFSVHRIESDVIESLIEYRDEEGLHFIRLRIRSPEIISGINSEDAEVIYKTIDGFEVMLAKRFDLITAVWQDANWYFVVSSDGISEYEMEVFIAGIVKIE